jgi:hypothetical protein
MAQIPLRRAHRLRAITLASPTKKLRPQPTERAPTAWHTNDEYKNAEASEEASASSVVAIASENRILPIPTPITGYTNPCSYKRVSSVGRFYDGRARANLKSTRERCKEPSGVEFLRPSFGLWFGRRSGLWHQEPHNRDSKQAYRCHTQKCCRPIKVRGDEPKECSAERSTKS